MSSSKPLPESIQTLQPEYLDRFFAPDRQRTYVSILLGRGGLTRRRAECFVRLWAYLLLKQQRDLGTTASQPLSELSPPAGAVACTHREAADLFYGNQDRGSDRAAGMMIDQLSALGLIEKQFDGQTLCLTISPLPELATLGQSTVAPDLKPDLFNPRTDAIPIANCMASTYAWLVKDSAAAPQKIVKALRHWSRIYPKCLRVLRRQDNHNPVAIAILYPSASESEDYFFRPPGKSFYLSADVSVEDPIKMAEPGDPDCSIIYVRAWIVDTPYLLKPHLCEFLRDTQATLEQIQEDFPNLCDIYSPVIHPLYEELRLALGFQRTNPDHRPSYWGYLSVDRFLAIDVEKAVESLTFTARSGNP